MERIINLVIWMGIASLGMVLAFLVILVCYIMYAYIIYWFRTNEFAIVYGKIHKKYRKSNQVERRNILKAMLYITEDL